MYLVFFMQQEWLPEISPGGGKGDWCVGLTTLPLSLLIVYKFWEPQAPEAQMACLGLYRDSLTFTFGVLCLCSFYTVAELLSLVAMELLHATYFLWSVNIFAGKIPS